MDTSIWYVLSQWSNEKSGNGKQEVLPSSGFTGSFDPSCRREEFGLKICDDVEEMNGSVSWCFSLSSPRSTTCISDQNPLSKHSIIPLVETKKDK